MVFLDMTNTPQGEQPGLNTSDTESDSEFLDSLKKEAFSLKYALSECRDSGIDPLVYQETLTPLEYVPACTLKVRRHIQGNPAKLLSVTWHPDGRKFATTTSDGKISVWNAFTSKQDCTYVLSKDWLLASQFSPQGNAVACGGFDNKCSVVVLNYTTEDETPTIQKRAVGMHTGFVSSCRFIDEQQILTGSGDSTCCLWDIEYGELVQTFVGHTGEVYGIDFTLQDANNPGIFVSGGADKQMLLWDIRIGKSVQHFEGHDRDVNAVRFSPGTDVFASASDDATCRLYDKRAEGEICIYQLPSIFFPCNSVEFSTSGRLLFGGHTDSSIHMWDALRGTREAMLMGHESRVSCLRMSPDGLALASSSWDGCCTIWA